MLITQASGAIRFSSPHYLQGILLTEPHNRVQQRPLRGSNKMPGDVLAWCLPMNAIETPDLTEDIEELKKGMSLFVFGS